MDKEQYKSNRTNAAKVKAKKIEYRVRGGEWREFGVLSGTDRAILIFLENHHGADDYRIDGRLYVK